MKARSSPYAEIIELLDKKDWMGLQIRILYHLQSNQYDFVRRIAVFIARSERENRIEELQWFASHSGINPIDFFIALSTFGTNEVDIIRPFVLNPTVAMQAFRDLNIADSILKQIFVIIGDEAFENILEALLNNREYNALCRACVAGGYKVKFVLKFALAQRTEMLEYLLSILPLNGEGLMRQIALMTLGIQDPESRTMHIGAIELLLVVYPHRDHEMLELIADGNTDVVRLLLEHCSDVALIGVLTKALENNVENKVLKLLLKYCSDDAIIDILERVWPRNEEMFNRIIQVLGGHSFLLSMLQNPDFDSRVFNIIISSQYGYEMLQELIEKRDSAALKEFLRCTEISGAMILVRYLTPGNVEDLEFLISLGIDVAEALYFLISSDNVLDEELRQIEDNLLELKVDGKKVLSKVLDDLIDALINRAISQNELPALVKRLAMMRVVDNLGAILCTLATTDIRKKALQKILQLLFSNGVDPVDMIIEAMQARDFVLANYIMQSTSNQQLIRLINNPAVTKEMMSATIEDEQHWTALLNEALHDQDENAVKKLLEIYPMHGAQSLIQVVLRESDSVIAENSTAMKVLVRSKGVNALLELADQLLKSRTAGLDSKIKNAIIRLLSLGADGVEVLRFAAMMGDTAFIKIFTSLGVNIAEAVVAVAQNEDYEQSFGYSQQALDLLLGSNIQRILKAIKLASSRGNTTAITRILTNRGNHHLIVAAAQDEALTADALAQIVNAGNERALDAAIRILMREHNIGALARLLDAGVDLEDFNRDDNIPTMLLWLLENHRFEEVDLVVMRINELPEAQRTLITNAVVERLNVLPVGIPEHIEAMLHLAPLIAQQVLRPENATYDDQVALAQVILAGLDLEFAGSLPA